MTGVQTCALPICILIDAEEHTRNKYYVENLKSLIRMLERDDYEVRAGLVSEDMWKDSVELEGLSGPVTAWKVSREGDSLQVHDFVPDLIINNNDFSEGIPDFIKNISQPLDPPPELGWELRRKSHHFEILEGLMIELADILDIDPWLLHPLTVPVHEVHFGKMEGLDRIAHTIDDVIKKLKEAHKQHNVEEEPFVFVKSNYGTYGMAVTTAASGKQFLENMKKERKKMRKGKGGVEVREVIVQEGVPTADFNNDCPVEPVIYIIGGDPAGGFYRINCERTIRENLNTRGMTFSKICFHQLENRKPEFLDSATASDTVMMRVWGTLARVAAIAAAYEAKSLKS